MTTAVQTATGVHIFDDSPLLVGVAIGSIGAVLAWGGRRRDTVPRGER